MFDHRAGAGRQRHQPLVVLRGEGGRDLRVPSRPRRDPGLRLGGLLVAPRPRPLGRAGRRSTRSRSARSTPRAHRQRGRRATTPRPRAPRRADRDRRTRQRWPTTRGPPGRSPARRATVLECRLERGAATVVRLERVHEPGELRPQRRRPTAATASSCARPTRSATSVQRRSPSTCSIAWRRRRPIDSGPGSSGTSRTPAWSFTGEPGAVHECRLIARAARCPTGRSATDRPATTWPARPTALTSSRCAAGTTRATSVPPPPRLYRLDTTGADVTIDSGPGPLGNGSAPAWAFSGEPEAGFECRSSAAAGPRRLGAVREPPQL